MSPPPKAFAPSGQVCRAFLRTQPPKCPQSIQAVRRLTTSAKCMNMAVPPRFGRYQNMSGEATGTMPRNPLNYLEVDRQLLQRNKILKKRIFAGCGIMTVLVAIQVWMVTSAEEPQAAAAQQMKSGWAKERLDAPPGTAGGSAQIIVKDKPGQTDIKVDEHGIELVETGTSSIPHFPRKIQLPSSSAAPSAQPISSEPGIGAVEGFEEYTLLGLGIRTVSFLSIQVYVLGMYVRTTDLDALQAAFVKRVNPLGSSLIPSEKEALRADLMSADVSLEIWNDILRSAKIRSAVRIVPTRGTDFNHLRDGWVRGLTARTQELSKKGVTEFEDESFGEAMSAFKALLSGRGKAPKGSTVLLSRNEQGAFGVMYEAEHGHGNGEIRGPGALKQGKQMMGALADERISRQVWLGYLGGKAVSSEGARKSIVDGVMELVERPVGTVATKVL